MGRLLLFGLLCSVAPWLLSKLHFIFGGLTRPLVYLLSVGQVLIVPVLVALDPNISFGSDAYSLGAGVGIVLIMVVESVFVLGTVLGLLAGILNINRRERAADMARAAAMFSAAEPEISSIVAIPETQISADVPAELASTESCRSDTAVSTRRLKIEGPAGRQSVGRSLLGAYLCLILASSGAKILIEGLTIGSYGWIRNFGAVSLADRPIAFTAVTIMFLTPTCAAGWCVISWLSRVWRIGRIETN